MNAIDLSAVNELRSQLRGNGYKPVVVYTNNKRPVGNAWTEVARKGQATAATSKQANTGILADGLRVVDIDVEDEEASNAIEKSARELLGDAPMRGWSNSFRRILLYRATTGEPSKLKLKGLLGDVEVLGRGNQFVAFGGHPSGVPYNMGGRFAGHRAYRRIAGC